MQAKHIYFLVNGNKKIGFGHVNRSLILANEVRRRKIDCTFLHYDNSEKINDIINEAGFQNFEISHPELQYQSFGSTLLEILKRDKNQKLPFLVMDSDASILRTIEFQEFLINSEIKFMHITVNNKSTFLSTIVLNQNVIAPSLAYNMSSSTKPLFGLEYFILNENMKKIIPNKSFSKKKRYNLLLTFGSADPLGITEKIIKCLPVIKEHINSVVVILGLLNDKVEEVNLLLKESQITDYQVVYNTKEMYTYMKNADIAFTSMGLTFWELILHNIPCIALSGSVREKNVLDFISQKNYCLKLGDGDRFDIVKWKEDLKRFFKNNKINNLQNEDLRTSINKEGTQLVVQNIIEA